MTKRTLLALIVSAVSVLGLAGSLVALPIYYDVTYGTRPVVVPAKEPIEFAGYTWTLTDSAEFPGEGVDENEVPSGNALVAAIIDIEPGPGIGSDDVASCDAELIEPSTGRTWDTLSAEYEFGYGIAEDSTTTCLLGDEGIELEVVFLTPAGVYDSVVVDVTVTGEHDRTIRFELVPMP